jgi:prepilin-type N-terminal cleavage/methylation domain-containing protein
MNPNARQSRRRRSGFSLVEVLIAVVLIGLSLVPLLMARAGYFHKFVQSSDQFSASWLAAKKMQELLSENLPDPEDDATWELNGWGDFGYMDNVLNDYNRNYNEDWVDRANFGRFEYEWSKALIFVGREFIGSALDLEEWEEPLDESGFPIPATEDPREQPAARVVRVVLTVFLPLGNNEDPASYAERNPKTQMINGRPAIQLVTYVDPSILFDGARDEADRALEGN